MRDGRGARRRRPPERWRPPLAHLVVVALTAAALGLVGPAPASASCVGPRLALGRSLGDAPSPQRGGELRPGRVSIVTGTWFRHGCADAPRAGCSPASSSERPARDVALVLVQGQRRWRLGSADAASAERSYRVRWRAAVPADVPPGPAQLRAATARLPVTVSRG